MRYLCEKCKRNKGMRHHHRYVDSYGTERSVTNVDYVECDAPNHYRTFRGLSNAHRVVREAVVDDGSSPRSLCGDYKGRAK